MPLLPAALFILLLLAGCADRGGEEGGPQPVPIHPSGWIGSHALEGTGDADSCRSCHGENLEGGLAALACTACHPFDAAAPFHRHPPPWTAALQSHRELPQALDWTSCGIAACHGQAMEGGRRGPSCFLGDYADASGQSRLCHPGEAGAPHRDGFALPGNHGPTAKADLLYCQICHARPFNAPIGGEPRFDVPRGGLADGCEDCHLPFTAHPVPWAGELSRSHATAGNLQAACARCHRLDTGAPGGDIGPGCRSCHEAASPATLSGCVSCHDAPPSGTRPPDTAGSHAAHDALPGLGGDCSPCHFGAGSGSDRHFNGSFDLNPDPAFDALGLEGGYSPESGTCGGLRCHGGLLSPVWGQETLEVSEQCRLCHQEGDAQTTGFFSGEHPFHVALFPQTGRHPCTPCHDPVLLRGPHFLDLRTPQFEAPASATLVPALLFEPPIQRCDPQDGGLTGCHGNRDWQ